MITILEKDHDHVNVGTIVHAKEFLDYYGVTGTFQEIDHEPAKNILDNAKDHACDLIILGGYSINSKTRTKKRVLDEVLQKSQQSILICR